MCPRSLCHGFKEDLFLPRHLRRDRVTGSLEGWSQPDSSASPLDDILDSHEEIFDTPFAADESQEMDLEFVGASQKDGSGNPDLPDGYLPDRSTTVKPLGKADVQKVLSTAIAAYNGFGVEKKFQISALYVELEKLLINDSKASVVESGGRCLVVPSEHMQRSQKRDRMKSAKDVHGGRKKRQTDNQLRQLSASAQNMGFEQTVSGKLSQHCIDLIRHFQALTYFMQGHDTTSKSIPRQR